MSGRNKYLVAAFLIVGPWVLSQVGEGLPLLGPGIAILGFGLNWWQLQARKAVIKDPLADPDAVEQSHQLMYMHCPGLFVCFMVLGNQPSLNPEQGPTLYFTKAVGIVGALLLAWQMGYLTLLKLGKIKKVQA